MAIIPSTARFRGPRRVRVIWTGSLAAGAFTSTSLYTVTNTDGLGFNPIHVTAVFAILSAPNELEIAVDQDFADGAQYQIGFTAVPCSDLTNYTGTLTSQVALQLSSLPNQEPETSDVDALLYGNDLAHDGTDLVQAPNGDLQTETGRPNWQNALIRRMISLGLTWDPSYSPQAEQFVDAPAALQKPFAGLIVSQAKMDDRTSAASVQVVLDPTDPGSFYYQLNAVPVDQLSPVTINFIPPS